MGCPRILCGNNKLGSMVFILVLVLTLAIWGLNLNQTLFYAINKLHTMLPNIVWLSLNFIAYTKFGLLSILLLVLTFLFRREKFRQVILLVIAFYIVFALLKIAVGEARPYIALPQDSFFWLSDFGNPVKDAYKSFPSGHTGQMAVFVFAIIYLFFPKARLAQILLFALLVLTGLARICTGWHWPIDVLTSGLIGYVLVRLFLRTPNY